MGLTDSRISNGRMSRRWRCEHWLSSYFILAFGLLLVAHPAPLRVWRPLPTRLHAMSRTFPPSTTHESLLSVMARLQRPASIPSPTATTATGPDPDDIAAVSATILSWRPAELAVELDQVAALVSCLAEAGISSADLGVDAFKVRIYIFYSCPHRVLWGRSCLCFVAFAGICRDLIAT